MLQLRRLFMIMLTRPCKVRFLGQPNVRSKNLYFKSQHFCSIFSQEKSGFRIPKNAYEPMCFVNSNTA